MMTLFTIALLAVLASSPPPAAVADDPHAACAAPPSYVPAELLDRPVGLRQGIGNSHETVTTATPDAQAFYDQGLNYLESYVWIEASRSFYQALRLDPSLAMAWIGVSRVSSGLENPAAARQAYEKAKALSGKVSARERRRIELRGRQLDAMDDLADAARHATYKKAIDEALAKDQDDTGLLILRGNAEEPTAAGRGQRGNEAAAGFYQQILKIVPDHATAHHYLVHAYETTGRIDEALVHGEAYARLAPAIPHAAHMYGHDLRRVGRMDEAIGRFIEADRLERAYYAAEKIDPALDWHHGHNLDLLATCYEHKGRMEQAEETIREAVGIATPDAYGAYRTRELPSFLLHRARYGEALITARAMARREHPQARAVGNALAGQALVALGMTDAARDALAAARRELEMVPVVTPGVIPNRNAVAPWVSGLEGELLLSTGKTKEGRELLIEVQKRLRATPGPDAWIQTLFRLETIARAARTAGDWELAEHTALQMIDHDAAYGGSHHALGLVLRNKGDVPGASAAFETARRLWADADENLPELREMAEDLADAAAAPGRP